MLCFSLLLIQSDATLVVFVALQAALFLATVLTTTAHSLVEVHLVGVELGAVYASEFGLTSHAHPARATHTRAVNHQRVERCDGGDTEFLAEFKLKRKQFYRETRVKRIRLVTVLKAYREFGLTVF